MFSSITRLKNPVKVWSLGVLLGLSVSTLVLPQDALAKSKKPVSASVSAKKTSKKSKSVKVTKAAKKGAVASKSKASVKSSRHANKKASSHTAKRNTVSRRPLAKAAPAPEHIWQNTAHGKQVYYIMPGANRVVSGYTPRYPVAEQQQPVAFAADDTTSATPYQVGTASYYNSSFEGKRTASGERFSQDNLTCAHGSLPFGCRLRVTNLRNNKSVDVRVNDRGGFHRYGRVLDLSKSAARAIGMLGTGTAKVRVDVLDQ